MSESAAPSAPDAEIAAKLLQQANKLLDPGLKNPLIQFDPCPVPGKAPTVGRRIWLGDFCDLGWLIAAIPDAPLDDTKKGPVRPLTLRALPPGASPPPGFRDPHGRAPRAGDGDAPAEVGAERDAATLSDILKKLGKAERLAAREAGLDVLRLVVGFLEWRDPKVQDSWPRRSPLLALPVSLRDKDRGLVRIGDLEDNPTLRHRLKSDIALDLPEWQPPEDDAADERAVLDAYLAQLERWCAAVADSLPGARVLRHAALGIFDFATIRLRRDLLDTAMASRPLVRALLRDPPPVRLFAAAEPVLSFDQALRESPVADKDGADPFPPLIFDADASQHAVLVDVLRSGKSLVVEGPPGTGKSQTIANLIAAAIGDGKRVLFVSQKRAALEVVRARLEKAGLGAFCLDLHGTGTTTPGFMQRVKKWLALPKIPAPKGNPVKDLHDAWRALMLAPQALADMAAVDGKESGFDAIWHNDLARTRLGGAAAMVGAFKLAPGTAAADGVVDVQLKALADHWPTLCALLPGFPGTHQFSGIQRKDAVAVKTIQERLVTVAHEAAALAMDAHALAVWIGPPPPDTKVTRGMAETILKALEALPTPAAGLDDALLLKLLADDAGALRRDLDQVLDAMAADTGWANLSREQIAPALVMAKTTPPGPAVLSARRQALRGLAGLAATVTKLLDSERKSPDDLRASLSDLACPPPPDPRPLDLLKGLPAATLAATLGEAADIRKRVGDLAEVRAKLQDILAPECFSLDPAGAAAKLALIVESKALNFGPAKKIGELPPSIRAVLDGLAASPAVTVKHLQAGLNFLPKIHAEESALATHPLAGLFGGDDAANQAWADWCAALAGAKLLGWLTQDPAARIAALGDLRRQIQAALAAWDDAHGGNPPDAAMSFNDHAQAIIRDEKTSQDFVRRIAALGIADDGAAADALTRLRDWLAARDRLIDAEWCTETPGPFANWDDWAAHAKGARDLADAVHAQADPARRQHLIGKLRQKPDLDGFLGDLATRRAGLKDTLARFDTAFADLDACLIRADGASLIPKGGSLLQRARELENLANAPALPVWLDYSARRVVLENAGRGPVLKALDAGKITADQACALDAFLYWKPLAEGVMTRPGLVGFSANSYAHWRDRFIDADKKSRDHAAKRIAAALSPSKQNIPEGKTGPKLKDRTDLTLLQSLIAFKKPPMSIRQIMTQAGGALRAMFPVFMMGPLAIAQYLRLEDEGFDLVVIDEASQLPLHEGLGALARGKQFVVVGDSHQMPPSSLFGRLGLVEEEDEDGDGAPPDAESILQAAQAGHPTRRLLWHYRSRHESLIQFSNEKVYDNSLWVFPARQSDPNFGVRLIAVTNPRYVNQTNRPEALTVVELLARLITAEMARPAAQRRGIGVVAINAKQADLIDSEFEARARKEPLLAEYQDWAAAAGEPLLIKNLENMQGDERDVIVISLTYGPNGKGVVTQNFGLISQKDGYRRLNVLFTRARCQMVVVSSLIPAQIKNAGAAPGGGLSGPGMLRAFLSFAATGGFPPTDAEGAAESPFETAVGAVLDAAGIPFDRQVGSHGARLDIAIRHPHQPGGYVLAIECDGEQYHRAASRREADRLRQERLEAMGWVFHRIWSSDWFNDRAAAVNRLLDACRTALANAAAPPPMAHLFDGVAEAVGFVAPDLDLAPDPDETPGESGSPIADLGTEVVVCEVGKPETERRYCLVAGTGDPKQDEISLSTPIGRAVQGRVAGERVHVWLPRRSEPVPYDLVSVRVLVA